MNSFLRFTRNYRNIVNGNKVVIVNRDTGMWMRISKECFDILDEAILKECKKEELLQSFQDTEDREYFEELLDNAEKLGVISECREAPKRIETVYLILTNRCNLKCKHCCVSAEAIGNEIVNSELNTISFKKAIDKIVACNPDRIIVSGGEPMIRKDFMEIIQYLRSLYRGMIDLSTNAILINSENVKEKDELILQSTFADLEDFYETIVLPPPARKPKGKPTVENHVRYLEIHLVEKLKEKIYVSFEDLNAEIKKIVAVLNKRSFQGKDFSRQDAFEKYDKPCMKPLPGGCYTACDYKAVLKVPNNYHIEYDGHYYSVLYSYCGKPAILKATASEIRICDQYNRLICTHKRSYREFPLYITVDEHMPPEHLYYKEVNSKDGNYYRRWASAIGPAMSELIDRLLKSSKHEEQSYNACAGILHKVKTIPKGAAEEVARKCIEINSCKYFTFKQMLKKMDVKELPEHSPGTLPNHENIRGKDYYK